MGLIVDACEVLEIQVRIDLGGTDIGMPEEFLDSPQIATRFQQVAGKRVSQHMGMYIGRQPPAYSPVPQA